MDEEWGSDAQEFIRKLYKERELKKDGVVEFCPIAYPEEYVKCMDLFKFVVMRNELSSRALNLTTSIIALNPAHYSVWNYRQKILLNSSIEVVAGGNSQVDNLKVIDDELQWLNLFLAENKKNYQLWHHRQFLIDIILRNSVNRSGDNNVSNTQSKLLDWMQTELAYVSQILELDAKNYHAWSYRQYFLTLYIPHDDQDDGAIGRDIVDVEINYCKQLIELDVKNNSAWNHLWFVNYHIADQRKSNKYVGMTIEEQVEYCMENIRLSPGNESSWSYLRAVLDKKSSILKDKVLPLCTSLYTQGNVKSSQLLEFLLDFHRDAQQDPQTLCSQLASVDFIRSRYWTMQGELYNQRK
ncbi:hypothetical protein MIR68_011094 [Amoeboaphelidium protococcarum]|nr:hypothetical protein MIR68_011094 [Amoeboaphelidium protococcarum]